MEVATIDDGVIVPTSLDVAVDVHLEDEEPRCAAFVAHASDDGTDRTSGRGAVADGARVLDPELYRLLLARERASERLEETIDARTSVDAVPNRCIGGHVAHLSLSRWVLGKQTLS